jgi:acyl-CoA reductase-like NAD-dependent aldehyde dehydrogenase
MATQEKSKTKNSGVAGVDSNGTGRAPAAAESPENRATGANASGSRVSVLKTYKIFIGGKFPRSESGRYYQVALAGAAPLANVCLCSRKDFREAVLAARVAQPGWSGKSAFNRSQILYRIAEMLEGRGAQFVDELVAVGLNRKAAALEVSRSIDRWIYYAGWCDKYQQVFGSVNPVASSHFNFSVPEPTGVVGVFAPEDSPLLGLVSMIAPVIAGGNTAVVLASESKPLSAISFSEVLGVSDLPGGVVNLLTGKRDELLKQFGTHMDVNSIVYHGVGDGAQAERQALQEAAALNVKRIVPRDDCDWNAEAVESPYRILDCQEIKTTWHPIENVGGGGSGY